MTTVRERELRICSLAVIVAELAALLLSGYALRGEWLVHVASSSQIAPNATAALMTAGDASDIPPRALLLFAGQHARAAALSDNVDSHRQSLAAALREVDTALRARPAWSDAEVVRCYTLSLTFGSHSREALSALRKSYESDGFLSDAAPWRVQMGLVNWDMLDDITREKVAAEAAWYSSRGQNSYSQMIDLMADSPAEVSFYRDRALLASIAR